VHALSLSLSLSLQGSIQQLVLTADPTAPNEQCEEDEPYVSVVSSSHQYVKYNL